ncbi:Polyphosphate kinase protein [Candidatus Micropelagos thuwalensis]|uniref:Aminotransferase n=1 Tax=Candidatus Micropelagius thuwalensis TaxID=1397666 RepID=U2XQV8_9PROT|nr:LL-diaminopimelate aminotransferase [Candidatus Micropelagos thuwalensis]ERL47512.1 Polyphosphate kinase protein [Candidatus Micropelagos thuwalensis]
MVQDFQRIQRLPPYVFEQVNKLKYQARSDGADIIDFGMGNPDLPTPKHIVDKLVETVNNPKTHRYSASKGIPGLRQSQARYYERRFGVKLNPDTEIIATLGSKEGFANMAQAMVNPGDVILVPNPTYPIHAFGFIISGATIQHLPILPDTMSTPDGFFEVLDQNVRNSVPLPKALVLNFPGNPTAEVVDLDFYKEVVSYCKKNDILILSDLAYAEIYYHSDNPPPSILQVDGAKDIAVEFTSLSKTYSMPGWRMGFAVGNERLIGALTRIKSYLDYGAFTPIQVAASAALDSPDSVIQEIRDVYKHRRDVLIDAFDRVGWHVPAPEATMFAWAPIPEPLKKLGSLEFSKLLLQEADIAVSPGIGFGEYGDTHVRIALVENEQRIRQAARNLKKFLDKHQISAA